MKDILLEILDWLHVAISNSHLLKAAWDLVHPLLKRYLSAEWLDIIDLALEGLTDQAMAALTRAKDAIVRVSNSNKEFMEKIRELDDKYYPGILKVTAAGALSVAAAGACGGAVAGGPLGAAVGAVLGVTAGAVGGFFGAGYRAVKSHEKGK